MNNNTNNDNNFDNLDFILVNEFINKLVINSINYLNKIL